ncbi:hypothetical protein NXH76_12045 [Blautia schinkii]|nr:hypothetical protein [Blautia schinkii]
MTFKEQLEKDLDNIFFNPLEFGEWHTINGEKKLIVVDNDMLAKLVLGKTERDDGILSDKILIFVREDDLDFEPVSEMLIEYDGNQHEITDVLTDFGGYTIILGANQG